MAYENPYQPPSLTGFNSSPPSDDGQRTASNAVRWATHLTKIGNPLKTYAQAISAAITVALDAIPAALNIPAWRLSATAAEGAVVVTDFSYEPGDIRRYGGSASASGAVNVLAVQSAINVVKAQGGGVIKFGPERYNLGTFGVGAVQLLGTADLENATFDFNGGELFITVTHQDANVLMLGLQDPINVTFEKARFICSGMVAPFSTAGPIAIYMTVSGTSGPEIGNVEFRQPYFEGLTVSIAVVRSSEAATRRFRRIRIYGGHMESCYYGPNFQQCGDDVVGDWTCHNVRRVYFPYGVRAHRVRVSACNDLPGFTADASIPIATQPQAGNTAAPIATQDIHVDATFRGELATSWGALVVFYHVGATTPQTIKDCSAFLNLTDATGITGCHKFLFKSHSSSGGPEETTTTANIWKAIRVDALCSEIDRSTSISGLLSMNVSPTTPGSIYIGPGLRNVLGHMDSGAFNAAKTNWRLYTSVREFVQFKTGDLTSGTLDIDLSDVDTMYFTLKLKIWAKSTSQILFGQDVTYREIIVTGFNAGAGPLGISQQDLLLTHSTGIVSTFIVGVSGENLTISFSDYTDPMAWALVIVEHLWPLAAMPE